MAMRSTRRAALALAGFAGMTAALAGRKAGADQPTVHRVAIQVSSNDPALMNMALNNVKNIIDHYKNTGEAVEVEVVTFGPGLHMLRADRSPVKERLTSLKGSLPTLTYSACENTRNGMIRVEQGEVPMVPEAKLVPSGVVRLIQLQEEGWSYIRP